LEIVVFLMQMVRWMTNDEKTDEDSEDMMKWYEVVFQKLSHGVSVWRPFLQRVCWTAAPQWESSLQSFPSSAPWLPSAFGLFGQSSEGHAIPCSDYQQLSMILSCSRIERVNQHAYHSAETETESQPTELEVIWQMISKASSLSWWEPWQLLRRSSLCLSFASCRRWGPDGKRIVIPSEIGQSVSRNRSIALSLSRRLSRHQHAHRFSEGGHDGTWSNQHRGISCESCV
jgi:hypothetical protein